MAKQNNSFIKALIIWLILYAIPLFLAAGDLSWWNAWAFVGINFISIAFINLVIYKNNPDLSRERASARQATKKWDKILVGLLVGLMPLVTNIIAGLDRRFAWTGIISREESIVGLLVFAASTGLVVWSMWVNKFFSSHYHIQSERGHVVIKSGPYALVRHPGYLGMLLGTLSLPILLESIPALWLGMVSSVLIFFRTSLEDRALQKDLPGYREYIQETRYRLVPFIW